MSYTTNNVTATLCNLSILGDKFPLALTYYVISKFKLNRTKTGENGQILLNGIVTPPLNSTPKFFFYKAHLVGPSCIGVQIFSLIELKMWTVATDKEKVTDKKNWHFGSARPYPATDTDCACVGRWRRTCITFYLVTVSLQVLPLSRYSPQYPLLAKIWKQLASSFQLAPQ